jgi:NAD(P)H dehydrogenase (quinone)
MKTLLILAHPLADSLNATLAKAAADELNALGHEVRLRDLYRQGFAPALTPQERQSHYTVFDATAVAEETEELQWAECVVLVFPTWWFGLPAILKGWIDRVWAPGIAYDNAPDMGRLRPRLHGLKHMLVITTLGSPWWFDWLIMWRPVTRGLKRAVVGMCAPKAGFSALSFYTCEKLSPEQVAVMTAKVRARIRKLSAT